VLGDGPLHDDLVQRCHALNGQFAVIGFTIVGGRIAALKLVADQARLRHLTIQP
jgi:hypothetical protein